MKCRTCTAVLPADAIGQTCRACLQKACRTELLRRQLDFVEQIAAGKMEMRLARNRAGAPAHLEMLGDSMQSYCDAPLLPPQRRTRLAYTEGARAAVCPACLVVFDQLWQQATIARERAAG